MLESINVTKRYGSKRALDGVNIRIEPGHIYGLLGPNGSGKSTWMKMAAGLIIPNEGEMLFDGEAVGTASKAHIAYMPTEPYFYSYMRIKDAGKYYQDFFEDFDMDLFNHLLTEMELSPDLKVKTLSSGMTAKMKIAITLARHARVYLLDERGKEFRSVELAAWLSQRLARGGKALVFVIGGAYGFSQAVYDRADGKISLSRMTFSHQMVRTIFAEQLYRAFTIVKGEPYHHE